MPGGTRREDKKKQIPPLRSPTRQKAARKKKSGRVVRDDVTGDGRSVEEIDYAEDAEFTEGGGTQDPGTHSVPGAPGRGKRKANHRVSRGAAERTETARKEFSPPRTPRARKQEGEERELEGEDLEVAAAGEDDGEEAAVL